MNDLFKKVLNTYIDGEEYDNKDKDYHKIIVNQIPEYIRSFTDQNKYIVKGSCGSPGKSEIPWIGIFIKNITDNAQKGIYIVYLFKADMTGFYLCLGQGVSSFKKYGKNKKEYMIKTAKYFKDLTDTEEFKKSGIDLKAQNQNGKDYCVANILSKYYDKEKIEEYDFKQDLLGLLKIYDQIYDDMEGLSYDQIVENVISYSETSYIKAEEAIKAINTALGKDEVDDERVLTEIEIPKSSKKIYKKISTKKEYKIDYIEKAKRDAKIGLSGEELVLEHEKKKMIKNKRKDLLDKIDWIAKHDESAGYDIKSFDFDEEGNEYEIYIEIKTTEASEKKSFFITANELNEMKDKKDKYWIYRVSRVNKEPKLFKINGLEFLKEFDVIPYSYVASIK